MKKIQLFNVAPAIPAKLRFLETLSRNLWWCWNADAIELFRRIHPQMWKETGSNPQDFLSRVPQKRLEVLASDEGFQSHQEEVQERFEAEVAQKTSGHLPQPSSCIAYFSLEFGIHESVRLYSGGLGVLAGDHLKSASDLKLPLVGVGLLYRQGYFQQYLNNDGWQQEAYPDNEIHRLPLRKALDASGQPVQISLPLPDRVMKAVVWQLEVGRVPLYLLDTNIPDNPPELQKVTALLYGGDRLMRLRQELLLGIGGFRALTALGYEPVAAHINEGHAAFMSLARISHLMKSHGLDLETVMEIVPRTSVFTTHTPVPAGNEAFPVDMLKPHLEALKSELGIAPEQVIAWGQSPGMPNVHELSMTILGLRMAHRSNGVSKLHGVVERKMWAHLWPGRAEDEVPIRHVTNGIHVPSWLSADNAVLFDRYLGPEWREGMSDTGILSGLTQIPDEELWRAHELGRARLVRIARELCEKQLSVRNATRAEITQAKSVFDYDVLTVGFARRFATYKRATLLLRDMERFEAILHNEDRPVQFVFAGKAHPADDAGKDLIRQLIRFSQKASTKRRVVFLENYDIRTARYLVQGVDVWMNTPRRPQEASGTSGMKAAVNGSLHASILDGWWAEGYAKDCGWAIGHGEEYDDPEYQDTVESQALYNLLENDIIPCFYDRPSSDVPTRWVAMMKASIKMALGYFTSHRMLTEYDQYAYQPARQTYERLTANNAEQAKALVKQHKRLDALWGKVKIVLPTADKDLSNLHVGDRFNVTTIVSLGELRPDEVEVHVYYGTVSPQNQIVDSQVEKMSMVENKGNGTYVYAQEVTCQTTGRYGFTTRIIPQGPEWREAMPGFMTWADGALP
jgi:starch phosphorylase